MSASATNTLVGRNSGSNTPSTMEDDASTNYYAPARGSSRWRQLMIMLRRNAILQWRYRKSTSIQIFFAPLILVLLLLVLQKIDHALQKEATPHPIPYELPGVSRCQGRTVGEPCINLLFTPNDENTRRILSVFAEKNAERTGEPAFALETETITFGQKPSKTLDMVPVENADAIYNYTLSQPNVTAFGVEFSTIEGEQTNIRYQIWYNNTLHGNGSDPYGIPTLSLMRGLDEAIVATLGTENVDSTLIDVSLKDWPKVPPTVLVDQTISTFGPMFVFCPEMVVFIVALNMIVTEKEYKLRESMAMMGLNTEIYWFSWFLTEFVLVFLCGLVTCTLGLIFQFELFSNANFAVLLITFVLFGMAMTSVAFLISAFVRQSRVAVLSGVFLFIIGLLFESFVFSNTYIGYIWWAESTDEAIWKVLIFIPFFNFGKIFLDISRYATGRLNVLTNTYVAGDGFFWDTLYDQLPKSFLIGDLADTPERVPPPIWSWYFLIMNIGVFYILAWYFDKVIPNEFGQRLKPWFFLTPKYWGLSRRASSDLNSWLAAQSDEKIEGEDRDVLQARHDVVDPSYDAAIRIVGLRKEYRSSAFRRTANDKVAVRSLSLGLREGELFALLGQNGAGKSTTMNILSGLTPPTSGDALIFGYSVSEEMSEIRRILGVCPQHDLLFNDLSALEHVHLYAGLKGVPEADIPKLAEERLKAVRLWNVRHRPARTYSGGMKRRLSVIISTLGNPKVLFLDEPTTGMDPVNRRHVWSFLEKFKKGRVIIMTSHSMEEADMLGDRIGIMALGRLRALGGSIRLKNRFGTGYRITIVSDPLKMDNVKACVSEHVPGAVLKDDSAGSLIYELPPSEMPHVPAFMRYLESGQNPDIRTWGVSQTTLEEVFLLLVRQAIDEAKKAANTVPDSSNRKSTQPDAQTGSSTALEVVELTEMRKND